MSRIVWQKGKKITYKHFLFFLTYEEADIIGKERRYGRTIVIGFRSPFLKRLIKAANDCINGMRYHYPICCIVNFCMDRILDRPSAQLRWSRRTDYVECAWHVRRNGGRKKIPEDLY
ncbi:MAG: hypothetical protein OEX01_01185 [Candidatus Bathyarchaeota archaeon]|nr:hypothetical protein [Candidatus Bathyarchaeota archaeon]